MVDYALAGMPSGVALDLPLHDKNPLLDNFHQTIVAGPLLGRPGRVWTLVGAGGMESSSLLSLSDDV